MTFPPPPNPDQDSGQPPYQPNQLRPRRRWWWIIGGIAAAVIAAVTTTVAIASSPSDSQTPTRDTGQAASDPAVTVLEAAAAACAGAEQAVQLGDDGRSIEIQTMDADSILRADLGEDDPHAAGASLEELGCILDRLETPDSVRSRMESTRALDGMQDATWGKFAASWTYHPDDGMWVLIEQV